MKNLLILSLLLCMIYSCKKDDNNSSAPDPTCLPYSLVTSNNGPVSAGDTLKLFSNFFTNATYKWTGPNNFNSTLQNPEIPSATSIDSGRYMLTVKVNNCTASSATNAIVNSTPCNLNTNTVIISDSTLVNLISLFYDTSGGQYSVFGGDSSLQTISITFGTSITPASGTYTVNSQCAQGAPVILNANEVCIGLILGDVINGPFDVYQALSGNINLVNTNNHIEITFCNIPFATSGTTVAIFDCDAKLMTP